MYGYKENISSCSIWHEKISFFIQRLNMYLFFYIYIFFLIIKCHIIKHHCLDYF